MNKSVRDCVFSISVVVGILGALCILVLAGSFLLEVVFMLVSGSEGISL